MSPDEAAERDRFCESCGKHYRLGPRDRVSRYLRPCPACGIYACLDCRPTLTSPCRVCGASAPSLTLVEPFDAPDPAGVEAAADTVAPPGATDAPVPLLPAVAAGIGRPETEPASAPSTPLTPFLLRPPGLAETPAAEEASVGAPAATPPVTAEPAATPPPSVAPGAYLIDAQPHVEAPPPATSVRPPASPSAAGVERLDQLIGRLPDDFRFGAPARPVDPRARPVEPKARAPRRPRDLSRVGGAVSIAAVIVAGVLTAGLLYGAAGLLPLGSAGPTGAVEGVTSKPNSGAGDPTATAPTATRAPAPTVTGVPLPGGMGLVVEAAYTRAWQIGQRTRGVVLAVIRNDGSETVALPEAGARYVVQRTNGSRAAAGTFQSVVPRVIPAGGRAYAIAVLPANVGAPRKLGAVTIAADAVAAPSPGPAATVSDLKWSIDKNGQPKASGTVTNDSGQGMAQPLVAVVFLDGHERPLAVLITDGLPALAAGATTTFATNTPLTAPFLRDAVRRVETIATDVAG